MLAAAELVRVRREQWARERAERRAAEKRRTDEERLRIARELHDVLAHSISVINVQAGVGLALLDSDPEQARTALTTIKAASKEALGEVRQVLDTLRAPGAAPRAPAPGLARLSELVEQASAAGLTVGTTTEGARRELPPGADLAAFRILQEALTNVVRHSESRTAHITLTYAPERLALRIDDEGPASHGEAGGSGNGLVGMRERAAALGGTIDAGPRPGGGFRVEAFIPLSMRPTVGHAILVAVAVAVTGTVVRTGRRSRRRTEGVPVIRVLLADDQSLVRAGFRALLGAQPDIEVAGEAADGAQALQLVRELRPDIVLMDIRMPVLDGLAATRKITDDQDLDGVKVVMLTTFELDEYVFEAIRSGASGFLVKDTEPEELLRAVRAVVDGDALLSPGVTRRLIAEFAARSKEPAALSDLGGLTDREREVMALVGIGLSNDEIARRLVVSPLTAKTHVSRAMVKLGARDRAQLVVLAYESGLVRPGWLG